MNKLLYFPVSEIQYTQFPSENVLFAASVAEFGILLRDSECKGSTTYNLIFGALDKLDCVKNVIYKDEFFSLAKKLYKSG